MNLDLKTATLFALICWAVSVLFTLYELFNSFSYGSGYYPLKNLVIVAGEVSLVLFLFVLYSKQKSQ